MWRSRESVQLPAIAVRPRTDDNYRQVVILSDNYTALPSCVVPLTTLLNRFQYSHRDTWHIAIAQLHHFNTLPTNGIDRHLSDIEITHYYMLLLMYHVTKLSLILIFKKK
jgi:hypothetical protein